MQPASRPPRENASPVAAPAPAAPPIDAVAQPPKENNTTYNPPNTFSATKTNTPIMDTPASVQVIPRAAINDVGSINVNQSLESRQRRARGRPKSDAREHDDPRLSDFRLLS